MIYFLYGIVLFLFSIYSYSLIDLNLTLFQNPNWTLFINNMVHLGYYERFWSTLIYIILVTILFLFNIYFINKKNVPILKLSIITSVILFFSYNFISHDFFNYIFDAKIFTFYRDNPYLHKPNDYQMDQWLRFMHWTHRNYPYGPTFLGITFIPSWLSFDKFILNFYFFKALFIGSYLVSVYYLSKLNKRSAIFFATSPLVFVEGMMNAHNDMVAVALGLAGIYYLGKKNIFARLLFLISGGIKFITLPIILLGKNKFFKKIIFLSVLVLVIYLGVTNELQIWYFLNLLIFLPYYQDFIEDFNILFFGLLMSYTPYIYEGASVNYIPERNYVIVSSFVCFIIYLCLKRINFGSK